MPPVCLQTQVLITKSVFYSLEMLEAEIPIAIFQRTVNRYCNPSFTCQLHSVRRQPTLTCNFPEVAKADRVLISGIRLTRRVFGQRSTCLQRTGTTESVTHTVTQKRTSGTSKVVSHALVVASTPSRAIACQTHLTFAGNVETHLTFVCNVCI